MITIHDKDFKIIRANRAADKILGLPLLDTSKAECFRYYHGTVNPPESCPGCQCLKTGKPSTFELFEPHLNMYLELRAMPRFGSNDELIGLIHVARDISERKKIEEEIRGLLSLYSFLFVIYIRLLISKILFLHYSVNFDGSNYLSGYM